MTRRSSLEKNAAKAAKSFSKRPLKPCRRSVLRTESKDPEGRECSTVVLSNGWTTCFYDATEETPCTTWSLFVHGVEVKSGNIRRGEDVDDLLSKVRSLMS